ncbi:putative ferric-chelate reductase 1 homolog [Pecten maximus]|uniref:putative ferric-chelate reductase 1 homolog n=1 Tax=Pecten maximus TaxID=6579 RepID=UPI00145867B6|nr:putative ferric-chelate reductase 1 homolog [Pecten maximus]
MWWVLLLSANVGVVWSYSMGAPPSTCTTMFPVHSGSSARTGPAPYFFQLVKSTYSPGESISVNLVGSGALLKGYQIQARDGNGNVVGQFTSAQGGRTINCGLENGALTHSNPMDKQGVSFTWQAPNPAVGNIVFIASIVQTYSVFWVNVKSPAITPFIIPQTPPPTQPQATTTVATVPPPTQPPVTRPPQVTTQAPKTTKVVVTQAPPVVTTTPEADMTTPDVGKVTMDDTCGTSKGCFVSCEGDSCDYVVTWKDGPDYVDFEVSSKIEMDDVYWIAIAFSNDLKMGDDDTVDCIATKTKVIVTRSFNEGKRNIPLGSVEGMKGLSRTSGSFKDGILTCKFRRSKPDLVTRRKRQAVSSKAMFDLNQKWYLMFGHGSGFERGTDLIKSMHGENPKVTPSRVDFQSVDVIGETARYPLIKVHAILMIIAWILCTGVGIVAARYYKPVWTSTNIMGQRIWFQIHRTCMVTALVLTVIGFVIIFVEAGGYSQIPKIEGKEYVQAHPPLGIIVTILAIVNPIMSIFRPGPKDEKRPIFNWAHWSVGMLAHILSVIAICFGMEMKKSTAPSYSVWVVVGYVIYHVIMEIILKSFDLYLNRSDTGRIDALGMTNTGASAQNGNHFKVPPPAYTERDTIKNPKDSTVKKLLLVFHMAIATAFTITLILLVAIYD